ncbi:uncharacterized protein LOC135627529 [Musa acuminata AAA Group]|uniref:uncharacterized protein LOC135627529 n=1 Tax=Musa acuminata AAA Group TaxID=214697 RepID=UPI0031DABF34
MPERSEGKPCVVEIDTKDDGNISICMAKVKEEPHEACEDNDEIETNIACVGKFTTEREDHTLGNLLEMQLCRDPDVMFSGYKVPSPRELEVELRVPKMITKFA